MLKELFDDIISLAVVTPAKYKYHVQYVNGVWITLKKRENNREWNSGSVFMSGIDA